MRTITLVSLFTVPLDFGAAAFDGNARYLEIGVRPGACTRTRGACRPSVPSASSGRGPVAR